MSLTKAIDNLLAYVDRDPNHDFAKYVDLDGAVYLEARLVGLHDAMPRKEPIPDIEYLDWPEPSVIAPDFELFGYTNCPGSWTGPAPSAPGFADEVPPRFLTLMPSNGWRKDMLMLRMLADQKSGQQAKPMPESNMSVEARALAVFFQHPDWTKKEIADEVGCHEKSLAPSRCKKLDAAIKARKSGIDPDHPHHRGTKDSEGNLEAYEC
jgi:hypothetical protein